MLRRDNHDGCGGEARFQEDVLDEKNLFDIRTPPVFAELLLRMVNELSDDIVSWSKEGDSFIIKKVPAFEGHLPSYYSHGNFASFVRQLNYYGFRRTKRAATVSSNSTVGGKQGVAGATTRVLTWDEFRNPLFRRGRQDLLVGIRKRRKEPRLRPKPGDFDELGTLNSLRADVDALTGDFTKMNGKLDNIMSLLSDVASSWNPSAVNNTNRGAAGGGGGGGSGFEGRNVEGWIFGGGKSDGDIRGSQDSCVRGAPPANFVGSVWMEHPRQGGGNYPFYPSPPQTPSSTQRYPVRPHQVHR